MIPKTRNLCRRCFWLVLAIVGLLPVGLGAQEDRLLFLPGNSVFEHLIGDPREFQSALIAEMTYERFDGSIAATPEFLQWIQKNGTKWGWGIEGDTFVQVEAPGYGHYSLTDSDYYLVLPERVSDWYLDTYLSESSGSFSNRLEFLHVSSQLGDGFFNSAQSVPYTQGSFRYTASYLVSDRIRLYAGGGVYTENVPGDPPFYIQMGTELYTSSFGLILGTMGRGYFTYDIQASQAFGGVLNQNFAAGFQWRRKKETHQAIRLALMYYNGNNDFGQFYRQNDNHWAIGLFFDP